MLEIRDLDIKYGNTKAVDGFDMRVRPGEVVSIVGESGSGKTTVLRSILGLLPGKGRITGGEIDYAGRDLAKTNRDDFSEIRGGEIAVIFQDSGASLNPTRRVGSQFIEYIEQHEKMPAEETHTKAVRMLERMNLPDPEEIMERYPFQLSGGQRQRVGIAMAMTFSPKILLADEPTSALDVTTQAQIVGELERLNRKYNTAVVLVTHNLGVAAHISDRIIVMKDGKTVETGTPDEIINHPKEDYTRQLIQSVPVLDGGADD